MITNTVYAFPANQFVPEGSNIVFCQLSVTMHISDTIKPCSNRQNMIYQSHNAVWKTFKCSGPPQADQCNNIRQREYTNIRAL